VVFLQGRKSLTVDKTVVSLMSSRNYSISQDDVRQVLEVLYQAHMQLRREKYQSNTYLTADQVEEAANMLGLPIPANYQDVLTFGVRKGTYNRCVESGTEFTGHKVLLYAYNPDMIRVNYAYNKQILSPNPCVNCIDYQAVQGAGHVTAQTTHCPCPGFQGTLVGGTYNISGHPCVGGALPRIPDSVIATLQRCCSN
jgi:hypothetical protein